MDTEGECNVEEARPMILWLSNHRYMSASIVGKTFSYFYICGDIPPGRFEPTSPRQSDISWVGNTPRSPVPDMLEFFFLPA